MATKLNWPLCADVFTTFDKLKISRFLFTERIWTYGDWIKTYEKKWSDYLEGTHAIMVSSGSTANELIALRRKWELEKAGEWPRRNKVVFPSNTWVSSVTPFVHAGFEPVFVDVEKGNLNVGPEALLHAFASDSMEGSYNSIGTVFYTSLLGFFGDIETCKRITETNGARFLMDNCESSFTTIITPTCQEHILNFATCSTSLFYSHFTTSGTEGGLIFTKDADEADWFRMMRNHGMTRGMDPKYRNPAVHPAFDFALMGSNYRSSNLQAYMALLDFDRALEFSMIERFALFKEFYHHLDPAKYAPFAPDANSGVVPLAIPVLCQTPWHREYVEKELNKMGVQTRPIIGGCLLVHGAFKGRGYGDASDFPNAMWSHDVGFYLGINKNVTLDMARDLALEMNTL